MLDLTGIFAPLVEDLHQAVQARARIPKETPHQKAMRLHKEDSCERIMIYISENPGLSGEKIGKGIKMHDKTCLGYLQALRTAGRIENRGSRYMPAWFIA